jgi:hypothetical protein
MVASAQRVTDRFLIRQAARQAVARRGPLQRAAYAKVRRKNAAVREITPEVLEAFGEFYLRGAGRVAFSFGNIARKLKEVYKTFKKAPKLWEKFKRTIGVESISDLPRAIKDLAKKGYKALHKIFGKIFSTWPLKLYTVPEAKIFSFGSLITQMVKLSPSFERWLKNNAKPKVDQFERWLKKYLPVVSTVVMVAIFIFIWMNVVEFEWDLEALGAVLIGRITLAELLASLPGSALGFLMNSLGLGTFTLLPAAFAAKMLAVMAARYVVWTGRGFALNREKLIEDGLMKPEQVAALGAVG